MGKSFHILSYQLARRRLVEGIGDRDWDAWNNELIRIKKIFKWAIGGLMAQLDREDPESWHVLGDAFAGGNGVERDIVQAEMWHRRAAEAGHLSSMTRLAIILSFVDRGADGKKEAFLWYQRAADLGHSSAMVHLGFAYREGHGVNIDERRAADWFIEAYATGSKHAAELAGRLLSYRSENHIEAVKWLLIAVQNGYTTAFCNLAAIYDDRDSPAYNPIEAFRCWLQVAERPRGDLRFLAMFKLTFCCRDGLGTTRSSHEAKRWLDRLLTTENIGKSNYRKALKLRQEFDDELF